MSAEGITEAQFRAYVRVQLSGWFNMFDPRARLVAGLERDTYLTIIINYEELSKRYPKVAELMS